MDTDIKQIPAVDTIPEVRIVSGIRPEEVEIVLDMAAASGLFSFDALLTAETMAWDSAYGDGGEAHTFLLAKTDVAGTDTIVGFLCFGPIPNWPDNYELYGIAVEPGHRRMGLGTGLVAEMKRQITRWQGRRIFLETGLDRTYENARLFYEANEFVNEQRFFKQFIPMDDGAVYRLDIPPADTGQQYH